MAEVVLEKVHKNYGTPMDAVAGVSFTCHDGEFLVLLGPSGCGKTTTLRMITGLETITSGKIKIDGKVVNDLSPRERNVAMAFETYALYPPLTVRENIAFPLQVMKRKQKEIDQRVEEVARALSITNILDMLPMNLAGGQQQRVSLARALVRDPTIFLMDEPLSHVDSDVRYRARSEIKHMQATSNATVIYVTHDQIEAVALADRVVVMDLGVIQQIGTPMELYHYPVNQFVASFIGEPPMNTFESRLELSDQHLVLHWAGNGSIQLSYPTDDIPQSTLQSLEAYHGQTVVTGVRPQRLEIEPPQTESNPGSFMGKLLVHEFQGNEGIAQISVDHSLFECITDPDIPYSAGEPVTLSVQFGDLHFFDSQTTNRINYDVRQNVNPGA